MKQSKMKSPEETERTIEVFSLDGNITSKSILIKECEIKKFLKSCCFGIFYRITRNGKVVESGRLEGVSEAERVVSKSGEQGVRRKKF